jgi:iron complex outermembrane receptor protein
MEIDDYVIVDLTLHRQALLKHLDISLAARNIFDEDAREPSDGIKITDDYPLEGRSLWCEVSYKF